MLFELPEPFAVVDEGVPLEEAVVCFESFLLHPISNKAQRPKINVSNKIFFIGFHLPLIVNQFGMLEVLYDSKRINEE